MIRPQAVLPILLWCAACSGGDSTKTSTTTSTSDTETSTDTVAATADTATASTSSGTDPTCEVVARDGAVHDCTDLSVFCDVSPENTAILAECNACFGNVFEYYAQMSDVLDGATNYYEVCSTVSLLARPETCSPHMMGSSAGATAVPEPTAMFLWSDDDAICFWSAEVQRYGSQGILPVVVSTAAELEPYVVCFDPDDYSVTVAAPVGFLDSLDFATYRLALHDRYETTWLGLFGNEMVYDVGCGGSSGLPPPVLMEMIQIDATLPATTNVSCRVNECPADVRDAPIPS